MGRYKTQPSPLETGSDVGHTGYLNVVGEFIKL